VKLAFSESVEGEILETAVWYEEKSSGLGTSFRSAVLVAIEKILENPRSYQKRYGEIRRAGIARFPYGIYYAILLDTVHVLGVLHDARHSETLQRRR